MIRLVISAVLFALSFPNTIFPFGLPFFSFVFAVPLLSFLEETPLLKRAGCSVLYGVISYALITSWLIPYNVLGYVLFVVSMSVQPVLFFLFFRPGLSNRTLRLLFVPSLWVASEYTRTLLLNGFSWNISHSMSFFPGMIQIANLFGSESISFVILLVNACIFYAFRDRKEWKFYGLCASLALAVAFFYGVVSLGQKIPAQNSPVKICAVQPNILSWEKLDASRLNRIIERQIQMTQGCFKGYSPDIIIWPETAVPVDFLKDPVLNSRIRKVARDSRVPMLVGTALIEGEENLNSAILLDTNGEVSDVYSKQHLVPFSEYAPQGAVWQALYGLFNARAYEFKAGKSLGVMSFSSQKQNNRIGVSICSEDGIRSLFREYARQDVGGMVVLLNDSWLGFPAGPIMHAQNSILRAVETGRPVIRVSNNGWSCPIDSSGRLLKNNTDHFSKPFVHHWKVPRHKRETLFNIIGDTFCRLCLVFVIITWFMVIRGNSVIQKVS